MLVKPGDTARTGKQRVRESRIFDSAHDQPGGDRVLAGSESGVSGFGDLGIGNPGTGVGVTDRAGITSRVSQVSSAIESMARATAVFLAITTEEFDFRAQAGGHDGTSAVGGVATNEDCAGPHQPFGAVTTAWVTIRPAPLPEPALPCS